MILSECYSYQVVSNPIVKNLSEPPKLEVRFSKNPQTNQNFLNSTYRFSSFKFSNTLFRLSPGRWAHHIEYSQVILRGILLYSEYHFQQSLKAISIKDSSNNGRGIFVCPKRKIQLPSRLFKFLKILFKIKDAIKLKPISARLS